MACCGCFFQGSKTWIALLVPVVVLSARLLLFHGILLPLFVLLLSTFCLSKFFKQETPITTENSLVLQKTSNPDSTRQAKTLISSAPSEGRGKSVPGDHQEESSKDLVRSFQDLYSESDQCSSSSSEDHSSDDTEWHYNMRRRGSSAVDCSDDSISDEESLFEIAIPSGLSLKKDPKLINVPRCFQELHRDFLADINEDNLIEIDITMGSIKYCSSFDT